eukprot:3525815-Prymnesium_polylepis.1
MQTGGLAPDGAASDSRHHVRRHRRVPGDGRTGDGRRREACRGLRAGRVPGPFSQQTGDTEWVSRAWRGIFARMCMDSGTAESPHAGRRHGALYAAASRVELADVVGWTSPRSSRLCPRASHSSSA